MVPNQNITTLDNICLNWPGYSSCDRIGIRKLEGWEDIWLCQSCYDNIQEDEERVSQGNMVNQSEENK